MIVYKSLMNFNKLKTLYLIKTVSSLIELAYKNYQPSLITTVPHLPQKN